MEYEPQILTGPGAIIGYCLIIITIIYLVVMMVIWRTPLKEAVLGADGKPQWPEIVTYVAFLCFILCIFCGLLGLTISDSMFLALDTIVMFSIGASVYRRSDVAPKSPTNGSSEEKP